MSALMASAPSSAIDIALLAQIIGYIGAAFVIASFQFRSLKMMYIVQGIGNMLFTVSFIMTGKYAGALLNCTGGVRAFIYINEKIRRSRLTPIMIGAVMVGLSVLSYFMGDRWLAILPCVAQTLGTYTMATGRNKFIRVMQLAVISPLWTIYNVLLSVLPSFGGGGIVWGGVICEAFNMVSSTVFLIRMAIMEKKIKRTETAERVLYGNK